MQKEKEDKLRELEEQMRKKKEEDLNSPESKDDLSIDGIPDCRLKYQRIVKRAKAGMGKFKDTDFAASDKLLGSAKANVSG